jgi:glucose-1-phosphate thymidylyltransferase
MRIIIPMAGLGTRLRPHTHTTPKPLLQVAGKTVLDHVLDRLEGLHIEEVVFIVGHLADHIKQHVEAHYDFPARYVEQLEPKGQAHALYLAREHLVGTVFIIFVDTIFDADPSRFGVVTVEEGYITGFVEKPDQPISNLAIVGLYFVRNSALLLECIEKVLAGGIRTKGEYYLADALQLMVDQGARLEPAAVDIWADCGKPETLLTTNRYLLTKSGGTHGETTNSVIVPPVHISSSASITDSVIGPYVSIAGDVQIERSVLSDCIIDEGARIENVVLRESLMGTRAEITGRAFKANIGDDSSLG